MDDVEREEIDFSRLAAIVPEEFAGHWQLTVDFLKIVTDNWPAYLTADNDSSRRSRGGAR